jgi:hypothetical protein
MKRIRLLNLKNSRVLLAPQAEKTDVSTDFTMFGRQSEHPRGHPATDLPRNPVIFNNMTRTITLE